MEDTINIFCATDNNYAPYCGIMLTSLFESNKDCHFVVYIFQDGSVTEENVKKYERLAIQYGNEIVLKTVAESMVKGFPINEEMRITLPTYYRLLAADLLPKDVHKIIYLDCDAIVVGDIKQLWNVCLNGLAFAGVKDRDVVQEDVCTRLGYHSSYGYVNAGVLVLNLDYWREHAVLEKASRFVSTHYSKLLWMDQDVLNGTLYDKKKVLPARYNFMTLFFLKENWEKCTQEQHNYYIEESEKMVVMHYAGKDKPWLYRSYVGPFFSEWENRRRKALWRNCRDIKPLQKHIKYLVKRHLFPCMIRNQRFRWAVVPDNKKYYNCVL